MMTVSVRYKSLFARTDAEEVAEYLSDLLRQHPNCRFYLFVLPNRMLVWGTAKDDRTEQWRLREFRFYRDDVYKPFWLFLTPFLFLRGEYAAMFYGGAVGKVEREQPAAPLYFYLLGSDIGLTEDERKAGGTKEAVWEVFEVRNRNGYATIRPLLSETEPLAGIPTLISPLPELYNTLTDYMIRVLWQ
jgi:hypothetical protein